MSRPRHWSGAHMSSLKNRMLMTHPIQRFGRCGPTIRSEEVFLGNVQKQIEMRWYCLNTYTVVSCIFAVWQMSHVKRVLLWSQHLKIDWMVDCLNRFPLPPCTWSPHPMGALRLRSDQTWLTWDVQIKWISAHASIHPPGPFLRAAWQILAMRCMVSNKFAAKKMQKESLRGG